MRFELQRTNLLSYLRWYYVLSSIAISMTVIGPLMIPVFVAEESSVPLIFAGIATVLTVAITTFLTHG